MTALDATTVLCRLYSAYHHHFACAFAPLYTYLRHLCPVPSRPLACGEYIGSTCGVKSGANCANSFFQISHFKAEGAELSLGAGKWRVPSCLALCTCALACGVLETLF